MELYSQESDFSLISANKQDLIPRVQEHLNKSFKICALVPAYNAAATLEYLLHSLLPYAIRIVVIDDGSTDETARIARGFRDQGVVVLKHKWNRGKGAALQTGYAWALKHDFDLLVTMDSDLQHLPDDLPGMVEILQRNRLDFLIGSRFKQKWRIPFFRRTGNRFSSWIASNFCRQKIQDSQCGFRLFRLPACIPVLRAVAYNRFAVETEVILKISLAGLRTGFAPIRVVYPESKTHQSHYRACGDTLIIFWLYTKEFYRRNFTRNGRKDLRQLRHRIWQQRKTAEPRNPE
jgi:glycosyltransferase involved in cell wall biosynthesis